MGATIRTRCGGSGRALTLRVDFDGNVVVLERGAAPLLFEPTIDWERFEKPHILDDF